MTDRGFDSDDTRLPRELARWFDGEVRQADLDLRRSPLRPIRARRGPARGIAAPAAGAILVVVLVIAGISRLPSLVGPATESTDSPAPPATFTGPELLATATLAPTGVIERRYGDGIPASIDGERVVRPSTIDRLGPNDERPFLLGGWLFDWKGIVLACALVTPMEFGPRCMSPYVSETPMSGPSVILDGAPGRTDGGPVVFRVHRHDEQAATCDPGRRETCELTAVIEAVVWAGDDATVTEPISAAAAGRLLRSLDLGLGGATITAVPPSKPAKTPAPTLPSSSGPINFSGLPPCNDTGSALRWSIEGAEIGWLGVYPSAAAAAEASGCGVFIIPVDGLTYRDWLTVENVRVQVIIQTTWPVEQRAGRMAELRAALVAAASD